MARLQLARELAEATGRSVNDSLRFIKQVGEDTAQRAVRTADSRMSWKLPAAVTAGTGGVLFWREQTIREAEAIADQSDNALDALAKIMDSDLSANQKHRLAESIADDGFRTDQDGSDSDDTGSDTRWPFDDLLGGDLQQTMIMIIVLLVVLAFAVNYASNIGMSAAQGGGS